MTNSDWQTTPIATVSDVSYSPLELLHWLHLDRCLVPLLREAVVGRFLLNQAQKAGVVVPTETLQAAANRFRYQHGLGNAEQTRQWLSREGLSADDFEAALERDLLIDKFKHHLMDSRVPEHFVAHRDRYAHAHLRQIVVGSEEVARELLAQLTDEGRDFAALAREHSLHGPSRLTGGDLGLVPRYALPAAAAEAVFAAKPGTIVGPVATDQGVHLFLVEALPEPTLDDATAAVIREELFAAWLREQIKDVRIDLSWLKSS